MTNTKTIKQVKLTEIKYPARHIRGETYQSSPSGTFNADITPGVEIRIHGIHTNHAAGAQNFDRVFKIGDEVEYGSYNLIYTGKIVAIGAATVTVDCHGTGERRKRMNLCEFIDRNHDLDLAKIAKHNGEEMMCI